MSLSSAEKPAGDSRDMYECFGVIHPTNVHFPTETDEAELMDSAPPGFIAEAHESGWTHTSLGGRRTIWS